MYTKQDKYTICLHPNPGGGANSLQSIPDQDREHEHQEMQKHLGQLRALAEQDLGNICFYCPLSCLVWDKIDVHGTRGVQRTIARFSSHDLWRHVPRQSPACFQPWEMKTTLKTRSVYLKSSDETKWDSPEKKKEMLTDLSFTGIYLSANKSSKYAFKKANHLFLAKGLELVLETGS